MTSDTDRIERLLKLAAYYEKRAATSKTPSADRGLAQAYLEAAEAAAESSK